MEKWRVALHKELPVVLPTKDIIWDSIHKMRSICILKIMEQERADLAIIIVNCLSFWFKSSWSWPQLPGEAPDKLDTIT